MAEQIKHKFKDTKKFLTFVLVLVLAVTAIFSIRAFAATSPIAVLSNPNVCYDTDNGLNYFTYGEVYYKKNTYRDSCTGNWLIEWDCMKAFKNKLPIPRASEYECPNGCVNGACIVSGECINACGDGICQEMTCLVTDCPCAESAVTCPQDCA